MTAIEKITTASGLHECIASHPYLVLCAYIPNLENYSTLLSKLNDLASITPGIVFAQADFTLPDMSSFKSAFGLCRFPSVVFVARGDVKEITVGGDADNLLGTLAKWYKTVYSY